MSGHTPGPWKLNDFEAHPVVWKGEENVRNHALIARVSNWSGEGGEWRDQAAANARLIAAAPDLLWITSRLATLAEGLGNGNSGAEAAAWRLAEEARALIAKAEAKS